MSAIFLRLEQSTTGDLLVTAFICYQGNQLLSTSASVTVVLYLHYPGKPLITNRILQLPGGSNLNALCYGGVNSCLLNLGKAFNTLGTVPRKMVIINLIQD